MGKIISVLDITTIGRMPFQDSALRLEQYYLLDGGRAVSLTTSIINIGGDYKPTSSSKSLSCLADEVDLEL